MASIAPKRVAPYHFIIPGGVGAVSQRDFETAQLSYPFDTVYYPHKERTQVAFRINLLTVGMQAFFGTSQNKTEPPVHKVHMLLLGAYFGPYFKKYWKDKTPNRHDILTWLISDSHNIVEQSFGIKWRSITEPGAYKDNSLNIKAIPTPAL